MKKVLVLLAVMVAVAQAGMWSTMQGLSMDKKKLTSQYVIDTNGYNPRVYEFDTVNGMKCVIVFSSSNEGSSPAMQCVKK